MKGDVEGSNMNAGFAGICMILPQETRNMANHRALQSKTFRVTVCDRYVVRPGAILRRSSNKAAKEESL